MSYTPRLSRAQSLWTTILDMDLTAQGTQTLSSDGTYTIGGYTWNKGNSANETTHAQLTAGTGLTFKPASATAIATGSITLPYVFLPLTQIYGVINPPTQLTVPGLDWRSSLRVWALVTASNPAAFYDNAMLGFGQNVISGMGPTTGFLYAGMRGYQSNGLTGLWMARLISGTLQNPGGTGISSPTLYGVTLSNTTWNAMSITMDSLWGWMFHANLTTFGNGPYWPRYTRPMFDYHDPVGFRNDGTGIPGDLGIWLGAQRNGSATSNFATTFARVRIDIKNN